MNHAENAAPSILQLSMRRVIAVPLQARRALFLLTVALVLVSACSASALEPSTPLANYARQSWVMENGLPQNTIHALAQTTRTVSCGSVQRRDWCDLTAFSFRFSIAQRLRLRPVHRFQATTFAACSLLMTERCGSERETGWFDGRMRSRPSSPLWRDCRLTGFARSRKALAERYGYRRMRELRNSAGRAL